jgi:hypothetical protein
MELWLLLLIFLLLPVAGLIDVVCAQCARECTPHHPGRNNASQDLP